MARPFQSYAVNLLNQSLSASFSSASAVKRGEALFSQTRLPRRSFRIFVMHYNFKPRINDARVWRRKRNC
jgi:hypothetical protein